MYDRIPRTDIIDVIQGMIKSKKLDPTMRFQLVENATTSNEEDPSRPDGDESLTIERIFPLDNR
jgi:hypothetical protein